MPNVQHRHARLAAGVLSTLLATTLAVRNRGWAQSQEPTVDDLVLKLFAPKGKPTYQLTADFAGTLTLNVKGSDIVVEAEGSFQESRGTDAVRHRKVTVRRLTVPLLLRPFVPAIRRVIEERIETQPEDPKMFHAHDLFILAELPGRRYTLAGVHRAIVDEAIDRYGKPEDKEDIATRRKIAEWLYSAPTMRSFLVRPGPPYALQATVDAGGLLYELALFYDWGAVHTRVGYAMISGHPVWTEVVADTISTLPRVGQVTGQLSLRFTNHCLDCR